MDKSALYDPLRNIYAKIKEIRGLFVSNFFCNFITFKIC